MRLGVVTTSYPRHLGDAAGSFVAELTHWLASSGHQIEVVAAGDAGHRADDGLWPIRRVPAAPGLFYQGGAPDALRSKRRHLQAAVFQARLIREVRKGVGAWDAMVAHWLTPSAIACSIAAGDKPLWGIAHGGDVHLLERLRLTSLVAKQLDRPNVHLNFVSTALRDRFARNAGSSGAELIARASVASMGVNLERFCALKSDVRPQAPPQVVFIGRLISLKGVDTLVESLVGLDRECQVTIAGGGPMEIPLREKAQSLGLTIDWRGEVSTQERDTLLAGAQIVVVPSREDRGRSEGMPLIAIEALASGSQLIATRCGGLAEIPSAICHHVEASDPEDLRRMLREVLDGDLVAQSPQSWLKERAWQRAAPAILPGLNQTQHAWRGA